MIVNTKGNFMDGLDEIYKRELRSARETSRAMVGFAAICSTVFFVVGIGIGWTMWG